MNPSVAAAGVMLDELARGGVTDLVLSPGSRSAPLALAAAELEREGRIQLHVRVDERSAGFLAVGLARTTGRPVVVICTSGTAVANLVPAVVEADAVDLPLILITADRPSELRGVGANQTIDQVAFFTGLVRAEIDLETPVARPGVGRYWRSVICQLLAAATDAVAAGPVHLNVPLRAPLVGAVAEPIRSPGSGLSAAELAGRDAGLPWTLDARLVSVAGLSVASLLEQLGRRPGPCRGVVVVGDLTVGEPFPSEATILAEGLNWPLLCEPSGNAHDGGSVVCHGSLLVADRSFATRHRPDVVVTVGRVGLTRAVNDMIAAAGVHISVDPRASRTPTDPLRTADVVTSAVPAPDDACRAPDDWVRGWIEADDLAEATVTEVLDDAASGGLAEFGTELTGPAVARAVWRAAGEAAGLLFLASSWPARQIDGYVEVAVPPPIVVANRGASGIDGLVSTAWGAALGFQRRGSVLDEALEALEADGLDEETEIPAPAWALLGDLAFLHDVNGLLVPAEEARPDLTVVVIDNDGGGIFSGLEQGDERYAADFERVFGTPTGRDLVATAQAAGVPAVRAVTTEGLLSALAPTVGSGVRVVVARVLPRAQEAALVTNVAGRVSAVLNRRPG